MSLLARSVARSVPRRGARFYSEEIVPTVVEPTAQWRAQQEAVAHHAHGRNIYLLCHTYIHCWLSKTLPSSGAGSGVFPFKSTCN